MAAAAVFLFIHFEPLPLKTNMVFLMSTSKHVSLFIIVVIALNFFNQFGSNAQLIPQDEAFNGRIFLQREIRKRKGATRSKGSRTLINSASSSSAIEEEEEEEPMQQLQHQNQNDHDEGSEGDNGFFACYLLTSINPRHKHCSYIGFTVNPRRRIRQHNGEMGHGAFRTKKKRPWEMVMCIYGFPTNVSALQFEWAWQHPVKSLAVREAAAGFKSLTGLANRIKLAYTMLTLPSWQSMNITVNFFSTKYMKYCAGCPILPQHMKVKIASMDELPCYTERADGFSENEDEDCSIGEVVFQRMNYSNSDRVDGSSENEDYGIDEGEFDNNNNTSNSDSVLDACDGYIAHDSPKDRNQGESFGLDRKSEGEPPSHSLTSEDQSQAYDSITSPLVISSTPPSLKRVEIIEDADFMRVPFKINAELSQSECEQSGAISAANKNLEVRSKFIVPHEADIIDLSTPSPRCRIVVDNKRRKVSSSVGADFVDLTKSPNFVQL